MSWRDKLRKPSFRGVPFDLVVESGIEVGRRLHVHTYPKRDLPWAEDLGRRARAFRIAALIVGDDYLARRDALIDAVEKAGPGVLVHPYYGEKKVVVTACSVTETSRDGRQARLEISFLEAGENKFPNASTATAEAAALEADTATSAINAAFGDRFSVDGQPQFVSDEAVTVVKKITATIKAAALHLAGDPDAVSAVPRLTSALDASAAALVRTPTTLAADITGLVAALGPTTESATTRRTEYRTLAGFGADLATVGTSTAPRQRQADNQDRLVRLVARSALAEAVRAASVETFTSYDEANAVRDELAADLDNEIRAAGDAGADTEFEALRALKTAMVTDITARGGTLARIVRLELPAPRPALAIAYELYDDAGRDAEIIARNRVRHPGFVPASPAIEVLSR